MIWLKSILHLGRMGESTGAPPDLVEPPGSVGLEWSVRPGIIEWDVF